MKSEKENQPIDDLFARKLGNLSLPPSAGSFERLQARINQRDQKTKVVIWRNPVMQRSIAVAACLLLVCLFGWLYWPNAAKHEAQVAVQQTDHSGSKPGIEAGKAVAKTDQDHFANKSTVETADEVAETVKTQAIETHTARMKPASQIAAGLVRPTPPDVVEEKPVLAQARPTESNTGVNQSASGDAIHSSASEQLAEASPKAKTPAERVLVVTIEEPAALVAARQAKTTADEKIIADQDDSKETKGNSIWQQVKRLKHGELFAQRDKAANDDQGLIGRAYTGLKQSFDKGKSTKQ